ASAVRFRARSSAYFRSWAARFCSCFSLESEGASAAETTAKAAAKTAATSLGNDFMGIGASANNPDSDGKPSRIRADLDSAGRNRLPSSRFMNLHGSTIHLATDAHAIVAVSSVVSVVRRAPRGF